MLNQSSLFSMLSDEELRTLESHANRKSYRRNTVVIEKGGESSALYILISGKARVFVSDQQGKELVLSVFDAPGTYFGELALLGETERTASVMTVEDSKLLVLSRQDFLGAIRERPEIALALVRDLAERVRQLTEKVSSLALDDVYGRLVAVLEEEARDEDGRRVTGRLTQQEIGQRVGASREMISRIFKDLRAGGYIAVENKRVVLFKKLPPHW